MKGSWITLPCTRGGRVGGETDRGDRKITAQPPIYSPTSLGQDRHLLSSIITCPTFRNMTFSVYVSLQHLCLGVSPPPSLPPPAWWPAPRPPSTGPLRLGEPRHPPPPPPPQPRGSGSPGPACSSCLGTAAPPLCIDALLISLCKLGALSGNRARSPPQQTPK